MLRISKSFPFYFAFILIACGIWASSVALGSVPGNMSTGEKAGGDTLFISCSPERPVVSSGSSIHVEAWTTTSEGKPVKTNIAYAWSASTGRIRGEGAKAKWDLKDSKPHNYIATVQATTADNKTAQCSLEIVVEPSRPGEGLGRNETRGKYETGRSFLLPDQQEHKGYGLYSYLLLGAPPLIVTGSGI